MRGRGWLGAGVVVVACALAVSACTGDSKEAVPTQPSRSSTTVEPSEPTEPTGPVEPTVPAAAQGGSAAAAKAFVGYYIELLNYSANTGDTRDFADAATPGCVLCADYVDLFESTYEAGGFMRTRGFTVDQIGLGASDAKRTFVSVVVTSRPVTYKKSANADTKRSKAKRYGLSFGLKPRGESWVVDAMEET